MFQGKSSQVPLKSGRETGGIKNYYSKMGVAMQPCHPRPGRLRWEDCKFEVSLITTVKSCLKTQKRTSNSSVILNDLFIFYVYVPV